MKKVILFAVICCTFSFLSKAQYTTADVFKVDEITFYGLDFSNIKLVGSDGFTDPWDIKNRLFNSWNMLDRTPTTSFCWPVGPISVLPSTTPPRSPTGMSARYWSSWTAQALCWSSMPPGRTHLPSNSTVPH